MQTSWLSSVHKSQSTHFNPEIYTFTSVALSCTQLRQVSSPTPVVKFYVCIAPHVTGQVSGRWSTRVWAQLRARKTASKQKSEQYVINQLFKFYKTPLWNFGSRDRLHESIDWYQDETSF